MVEAMDTERCLTPGDPSRARNAGVKTQLVGIGQMLIAVQNANAFSVTIGLKYVREDGRTIQLTDCSALAQIYEAPARAKACRRAHKPTGIKLRAHSVETLPLRFALLSSESPQTLQGAIYIRGCNQTLVVPVTAAVEGISDVQLEPSTVQLSADTWSVPGNKNHVPGGWDVLPLRNTLTSWTNRSTTVTATGPGVGEMLARRPPSPRTIFLHDRRGDTAELQLGRFRAVNDQTGGSDPLQAVATLKLINHPPPGSYSGHLGLSELDASASVLNIELNTHLPAWLAVVCVLLGVILAMVVAPLAVLRRHAAELRSALDHAINRYRLAAHSLDDELSWDAVLWNLNDVATTTDSETIGPVSMAETLSDKIDGERDDEDFNEDRSGVLEVTAHLARWLRVAPAALRLHQVGAQTPSIKATATAKDTLLLQRMLKSEPEDVAATDDLVARVLHQTWWHQIYYETFNAARAKKRTALKQKLNALDHDLEQPDALTRTSQEQCGLDTRLVEISKQLNEDFEPTFPGLPVTAPVDHANALDVHWNASPNLFSGWSTLDGASFRNLSADTKHRRRPQWQKPTSAEWLWSLFFTLVMSIVYAFTVYGETWGSLKDILTALTAGFAGAVTLKIALPIFESQRLRPPASSPSP